MWTRGIIGGLCCAVGAVWFLQGVGALQGSGMSGHGQWAVIGGLLFVAGVTLMVWAARVRRRRIAEPE